MSRHFRPERRRTMTRPEPSIVHQVTDLTNTLHQTDRNMARNETLLSDFVEVAREQDNEISELQDDLDRSKHLLTAERSKRHYHRDRSPSVRFVSDSAMQQDTELERRRLANELEREKLARERSEINNGRLIETLNASSKPSAVSREREPVAHSRNILKENQLGREMRNLANELSEEKDLLDESIGENRHLSHKLSRIEKTLDKLDHEKRLTVGGYHRTSKRLDHALQDRDYLLQQIENLQDQLYQSECDHSKLTEQCEALQQVANTRGVEKLKFSKELQEMDASLQETEQEKAVLNEKCHRLKDSYLQAKEEAKRLEQLCSDLQLEKHELATDRSSIVEEVMSLNSELKGRGEMAKHLTREVNALNNQLDVSESNRKSLIGQFETMLQKLEGAEGDKTHLLSQVKWMEGQLQSSEDRAKSTREQAVENIKKYKAKLKQQERLSLQLNQDKSALLQQFEVLGGQVQHYQGQAQNENAFQEENLELKTRLANCNSIISEFKIKYEECVNVIAELNSSLSQSRKALESARAECDAERDKNEQILTDKIQLSEELTVVRQELAVAISNHQEELDQMTQQRNKQVAELEKELNVLRVQTTELSKKLAKSTRAYQGAKVELVGAKRGEKQSKDEVHKLQQQMLQLEQSCSSKEQEARVEIEELKMLHLNEIEYLTDSQRKEIADLENQISELQVLLADQQSTVRAVKRQQIKMFDDQYKFGDDISQSLADTEKLRRKYMRAKRFYEEKVSALEREQVEIKDEENDRLRHQLQEISKKFDQQAEDHEAVLRAATTEMNTLVDKVGEHANIPTFPTLCGQEIDARKWIADTLAKLQWLQKETNQLFGSRNQPKKL